MKLSLLLIFLPYISIISYGQGESSIWYFGNKAGIKFNQGVPFSLTDGALDSFEGCSSIADQAGNLLFYTNGSQVWNRNHSLMGGGLDLKGHESSTQSSLIIAKPYASGQYYLFTTNALENGIANVLAYSIVDMTKEGGLGAVLTKNIVLHQPVTERLTAIKHANNRDVWLITHEWATNAFYAYLITPQGVNSTPIISNTGSVHIGGGGYPYDNLNAQGALKASPNGTKLAVAIAGSGLVELFDFDPSQGIVSNSNTINVERPYGIEFSPNGTKLYVSTLNSTIYQYNLAGCSSTSIPEPGIVVATTDDIYLGSMQLGPDKKIYVARYKASALGVISSPDKLGSACDFNSTGVSLQDRQCSLGLPGFVQSSFMASAFEYHSACSGTNTVFTVSSTQQADSVQWNIGSDGKVYKGLSILHKFELAGIYPVRVDIYHQGALSSYCQYVSISQPYTFSLGKDTTICQEDSLILDASAWQGDYLWQDGSQTSTLTVTQPGIYWIEVNNAGCVQKDSIVVELVACPIFIPNVITPNGDESNQAFFIKGIKERCEIAICNRWGKIIYETKDYKNNWEATGAVSGLYYYIIKDVDRQKTYKGWLQVLR